MTRPALGLTRTELAVLGRLDRPERIQQFVSALPANHEPDGETLLSVRSVLAQRRAHCMEAAMLAACALWLHDAPPLLMHMACAASDYPHVIALFRHGARWGAISKSNGLTLRYRDPVYASLRELAMSYFHEFFDRDGHKTLRSYGRPFDLRYADPATWVTAADPCWAVHDRLAAGVHRDLLTAAQAAQLSRRDAFERESASQVQYPAPG